MVVVGVMPLLLFFDYRMVGVGVKIRRRLWLWSVSLVWVLLACCLLGVGGENLLSVASNWTKYPDRTQIAHRQGGRRGFPP